MFTLVVPFNYGFNYYLLLHYITTKSLASRSIDEKIARVKGKFEPFKGISKLTNPVASAAG